MRRFLSTLCAVAFIGIVACSAYDLSPLTNGKCAASTKACEVKGVQTCVPTTDPKTGCARTSCLPCGAANVETAICSPNGECAIGVCNADFSDCDQNAPGCETEVAFDPNNCGSCGNVCATPPNATAVCKSRICGVGTCTANFGNCDGDPVNGCEANFLTSNTNCGKCASPCTGGTTCTNGSCI